MARYFISKGVALPAYILIVVAFYSISANNGFQEPLAGEMLLYNLIAKPFIASKILHIILSASLITLTAFISSSFINKYYLTGLRTHLPLFLNFMLFTAGGLFAQVTPGLFSVIVILFSLYSIFESFDKDNAVFNANSSAIGISIAILLYFPFIYLIPVLIIAMAILKQLNIKSALAVLTGSTILPLILGGLFFYYDNWEAFFYSLRLEPVSNEIIPPKGYWLFLGVITVWTIIGYIYFSKQAPLKKIRPRKIYNIINAFGLVTIVAMVSGYASVKNTAPILILMILFLINHMYPLLNRRTKIIFLASTISSYLFSFVNTL